jgi:hypothetical protein
MTLYLLFKYLHVIGAIVIVGMQIEMRDLAAKVA